MNHCAPHHAIEDAEDRAGFWATPERNSQYAEYAAKTEESNFSIRVDRMPGNRRFIAVHDMDDFGSSCIQLDLTAVQFRALMAELGRMVF